LRLGHEPIFAQLAYSIRTVPGVAHVAFPQSSRGSALRQLPGISDEWRNSLEKIDAWTISSQSGRDRPEVQNSRGDAGSNAHSRPLFEPKLHFKDVQLSPVAVLPGSHSRDLHPLPEGARRGSCGAR
jgi:hypothetical protein